MRLDIKRERAVKNSQLFHHLEKILKITLHIEKITLLNQIQKLQYDTVNIVNQ